MRRLFEKIAYLQEAYYWYDIALQDRAGFQDEVRLLSLEIEDLHARLDIWRATSQLSDKEKAELPW